MPAPISPPDEAALADLLLSRLFRELQRMHFRFEYLTSTKAAKCVYMVAESLELPLTRGWYKYGMYVFAGDLSGPHLDQLAASRDSVVGVTPSEETRLLQRAGVDAWTLDEKIAEYAPIFFRPMEDFLEDIYRFQAPDEFQPAYVGNFRLRGFWEKVFMATRPSTAGEYLAGFTKHVSELQRGLGFMATDSELLDLVNEFLVLFEDLFIRFDVSLAQEEPSSNLQHFLRDAFVLYDRSPWDVVAKVIGSRTVHGPSHELVREHLRSAVRTAPPVLSNELHEFKSQAEAGGFLPTAKDIDYAYDKLRRRYSLSAEHLDNLLRHVEDTG